MDDTGKVIGEGRDLRILQTRLQARAREVWSRSARASWEREGLTSWTFDAMPARISIQVAGGSAFAYPAIVDAGDSVALRALPSQEAAERATTAGLRTLVLLHLGESLSRLERAISGSLQFATLASRVADDPKQLRAQLVRRSVDEVFAINDPAGHPRDKRAFLERVERGRGKLAPRLAQAGALANELGTLLSKAEATLRGLAGKPGASRAALEDVRAQLDSLLPKGLIEHTPWERLGHLPRYVKAIQVRLERLPHDPRRDADKAAQVVPVWQSFQQKCQALQTRGVPAEELDSFRWLLEEMRVCLFAPELKTVVPVSPQKVADQWRMLAR